MRTRRRLPFVVALVVAGCSAWSPTPAQRGPQSPTQREAAGQQFGYVVNADAAGRTISFDPAQTLTGDAAGRAAEAAGELRPGEPVPNDHFEVNRSKRTTVLKLAPHVRITAAAPAGFLLSNVSRAAQGRCEASNRVGDFCTQVPIGQSAFFAALARKRKDDYGVPMWVTRRNGRVVRLDEQYFP